MMKHSKRFLCLLLTLILAASLCVFPAAAADQTCPSSKDDPVVFVHGLMGWGQRAGINAVLPYWGMTTGSLTSYLNSLGYETYSATVGPISSAWDRACELYAQLTGTTVDYGAAHAAAHDHARYGITYDQPLFAGWGTKRAVNLVGHSFGGATTRQFLELMANGSAEEVAAAKAAGTAPSPLFTGGKRSWVHSMTEIAAPHNGTTFIESNGAIMDAATNLAETLALFGACGTEHSALRRKRAFRRYSYRIRRRGRLRTHNGSFRRPGGLRLRVSVSDSLHTRRTSFKKICRAAHAPRYSRFAYGFGNRQEPNGRHCRSRKRDLYFLHGANRALYCRKFRFRTANGSQLRYSAPAGHYGRERFARAAAAAGIAFHPSHRAMQCCKRTA